MFHRTFALLLIAASLPAAATGVESAGQQVLDAWLAAYDAGDRAAVEAFRTRYGLKVEASDVLAWRDDSGPVRVLRIERDDRGAIVALLQPGSSDTVERLEFALTDDTPPRIASITYQETARPAEFALPRLSQAEALAAWKARGDELAAQDRFAGAALVARGGEVLAAHAWGQADRAKGIANVVDTRFRLGSMNKMFTAVAILQLAEAGRLSLDDSLGAHLTDYPNAELAAKVTLRHLLSHTGGTGDIFGPDFDRERLRLRSHADYLALYGERAPEFAPGSQFRYSNYGFILLGAVIERVSGSTYYEHVARHIFRPAGMRDSGSLPEEASVRARARPYRRESGTWVDASDTLPWRGTAAGGGYSTVGDLARFAQALEAGTLVPRARLEEALRPATEDGWYGLGFIVRSQGADPWYGHDGGAPGMSAVLHVHRASGYTVVVLSNLDPPASDRFAQFLELRLPAPSAVRASP